MDIGRFYSFSQCSLKMEAKHFMNFDVKLEDPQAIKMWGHFEKMASRNLGKNEKWVPFHTVLGIHEHYVVKSIHHAPVKMWSAYHRFVLMFVFRAHCKIELFEQQMPFFKTAAFWKDPKKAFNKGSDMHKMIKAYRAGGNALQTSCFLIIPERLVKDDDENIILNLLLRTQRLIELADKLWPVVNNRSLSTSAKFDKIKSDIAATHGLGETWVKMLSVVIDIARPELNLLHDRCEVGSGAADPLKKILEDEGLLKPKNVKEQDGTKFEPYPFCGKDCEIVSVKKSGKQLTQVTIGAAGSLDRAHAIAVALCTLANKGTSKEKVEAEKKRLLALATLKVPALGLEAKREEMLAEKKERKAIKDQPPTDSATIQGLVQLRDRIVAASKTPNGKAFSKVLANVEAKASKHFKSLPLVAKQFKMHKAGLSCSTLQVQLCEFRQFNNTLKDTNGTKRSRSEI